MGLLRYLDPDAGDVKVEWKPEDTESVTKAQGEFERLQEAGFEFFKEVEGKKPRRIKRFDKKLGLILAVPGVRTKQDKTVPEKRPRAMSGGPVARTEQ